MHIISLKALRAFWEKHPEAEAPMRHWHTVVERTTFTDFSDLRQTFGSVDYVAPFTVFNVGGNNYRVIAAVHYQGAKVYIREVLTHR